MPDPSTKKHIVMLNKAYPPWIGGVERHVRDISEALAGRGWRVTVLACNDTNNLLEETINGVDIIRMPRVATVLSQPLVFGYYSRLKTLRPDLVHVHVPFPLGWFVHGYISSQTPVVCTWHSDIIRQKFLSFAYRGFEQTFLTRCRAVLPTSLPLLAHSIPLSSHQEKCTVIPLAIREESVDDGADESSVEELKKQFRGNVVAFVGRLVGYKGLEYLIEAMRDVDGILVIAGDGPLRAMLEDKASRIPGDKIVFLGQVSEKQKRALYRIANVFVLPSIEPNEAFGYVLLEAMQHGCPLITTDLPTGVSFVNQHDETGLVASPRDANALAAALNLILNDESIHARYSAASRKRFVEVFDFEKTVDRIETVYRQFLG